MRNKNLSFFMANLLSWVPDPLMLKLLYRFKLGKKLNLKNPRTFNEKLQWLKLYDRKPEYTTMVDKYAVKKYVANRIGEEYIIPTLGIWDRAEDIDFDKLPNQFVLKTTQGGGGNDVVICKDKTKLNRTETVKLLKISLSRDIYRLLREWPYKNVPRRIIAEKYMEDTSSQELRDYKIFNFNGVSKVIQMDYNRFVKHMKKLYTPEWDELDFEFNYPTDKNVKFNKPTTLVEMLGLAKKLSAGIPFLRTDFYCVDGKTYFGELTFFPASGFGKFIPEEYDEKLGSWISIPNEFGGGYTLITNDFIIWLHPRQEGLVDYKIHCFHGEPKVILVCQDRYTDTGLTEDFYSEKWEHFDVRRPKHSNAKVKMEPPKELNLMLNLSRKLSRDIPFLRTDFYIINHQVYFGELTFYPASGFVKFIPESFDYQMGDLIELKDEI